MEYLGKSLHAGDLPLIGGEVADLRKGENGAQFVPLNGQFETLQLIIVRLKMTSLAGELRA